MTLADYIIELQKLEAEHGSDIEVCVAAFNGERLAASSPKVAYKLILKGRERLERFWYEYADDNNYQGKKVIKL